MFNPARLYFNANLLGSTTWRQKKNRTPMIQSAFVVESVSTKWARPLTGIKSDLDRTMGKMEVWFHDVGPWFLGKFRMSAISSMGLNIVKKWVSFPWKC